MNANRLLKPMLISAVALTWLIGCSAESQDPIILPTPVVERGLATVMPTSTAEPIEAADSALSAEVVATATTAPSPAPTATLPATEPVESLLPASESNTVVFVSADDVLNVRTEPGVENEIVGTIAPGTSTVQITGVSIDVDGSPWVPVQIDTTQGWVNSRFLTETVSSEEFCTNSAVETLLRRFEQSVENRNNQLLSQLVHPERGLRVRLDWWNPEVQISGAELESLFGNPTSHNWGMADGSGLPIEGSFTEVALPMLDQDLVAADTQVCNELVSGNTAGIVQLPEEYGGINYVSFHRTPTDELGFDWGTWVVGVEFWQGKPVVSTLVHYNYEI